MEFDDVVLGRRVEIAEVEVAPHRLQYPVVPYPRAEVGFDQVALRQGQVAGEIRRVVGLGQGQAVTQVIDLVAQRCRLELVDDGVAEAVAPVLQL